MEDLGEKTLKWMSKLDRRRLYTLHTMSAYKNSFNGYDLILREISDRPSVAILSNEIANSSLSTWVVDRLADIRSGMLSILSFMANHRWSYSNWLDNEIRSIVEKDGWEDSLYGYSQNQHSEYDLYELASITNPTKHNLRGYVNEKKCKS